MSDVQDIRVHTSLPHANALGRIGCSRGTLRSGSHGVAQSDVLLSSVFACWKYASAGDMRVPKS